MHEIDTLLGTLNSMRSAETFKKLYDEALIIAEQLGVTLCKPRIAARSVYQMAGGGNEDAESYYRINFWFATLDGIITDIQLRFGETQKAAVGLSRIMPSFMSFDEGDDNTQWKQLNAALSIFSDLFENPISEFQREYMLWRSKWECVPSDERPRTALETLEHATVMFSNIQFALIILATLPVTTVEAERFFSKMDRTLTAIRSSMLMERLEALLMIQVHRNHTPMITDVIDSFAANCARRLNLLL